MNRPDVLRLFATQHGVAALRQLAALGVSRDVASAAALRGSVERVHRGVYAIPGTALTFPARALALQLLAGPDAFLSGPTAGHLHGLRGMPTDVIEVTIDEATHATLPAPHRLVVTSWIDEARDIEQRPDGIRVASPLRTLFGLARRFNQHRFERAAEDLWHRGLVTPESADAYLTAIRQSGKHGVRRMEHWLERTTFDRRPSQSGLEVALVQMVERVGLPTPVRQLPLTLPSGETIHLDLAWPQVRLAIEPGHSWWHGGDLRQRADQARDRACALVGWHVHRYDESAASDAAATAREILALYRRRVLDVAASDDTTSA